MSRDASTTQADTSGVAPEDREILDAQLNGVESEKEAADVMVARMLEEERAAGRVKDQYQPDAEEGEGEIGEAGDDPDAAEAKAKETQQKAKESESESQRRRRLRRENADRQRQEFGKAQREIGRLQERLKQIETRNPDPSQYEGDDATYIADRAGFAAQYVTVKDQLEQVEASAKEHEAEIRRTEAQNIQDYFSEGNKRFPDFEQTIKSDNLPFTPAMMEALLDEGMHDVAYELAKQPEEVVRIALLPNSVQQVKEILRVQAALQAKAAERVTTKAPPPIKPIRAAGASPAKNPSEMTMAEYADYRRKQLASSR